MPKFFNTIGESAVILTLKLINKTYEISPLHLVLWETSKGTQREVEARSSLP